MPFVCGATSLGEAHAHVTAGVPFRVCPKCKGKECRACQQTGYWTRHRHDHADQYGGGG